MVDQCRPPGASIPCRAERLTPLIWMTFTSFHRPVEIIPVRDYYIDLGFIPNSQYAFPVTGGQHTVLVTVRDYAGNSVSLPYNYTVIGPPPGIPVWQDDFETYKGWIPNPDGSDTANSGQWEWGVPLGTYSNGPKQLGTTPSGFKDLVTGRLAGSNANSYDIDGGVTSIRSPDIILPSAESLTLSFRYYLAHGSNSSSADTLRVTVVGASSSMVFEELGAANNDDGVWAINNTCDRWVRRADGAPVDHRGRCVYRQPGGGSYRQCADRGHGH